MSFEEELSKLCAKHSVVLAAGYDGEIYPVDHKWLIYDRIVYRNGELFFPRTAPKELTPAQKAAQERERKRRAEEYAKRQAEIEARLLADEEYQEVKRLVKLDFKYRILALKEESPYRDPEPKLNPQKVYSYVCDVMDQIANLDEQMPLRTKMKFYGVEAINGWSMSLRLQEAMGRWDERGGRT